MKFQKGASPLSLWLHAWFDFTTIGTHNRSIIITVKVLFSRGPFLRMSVNNFREGFNFRGCWTVIQLYYLHIFVRISFSRSRCPLAKFAKIKTSRKKYFNSMLPMVSSYSYLVFIIIKYGKQVMLSCIIPETTDIFRDILVVVE